MTNLEPDRSALLDDELDESVRIWNDYIDGELSEADRAAFERQLEQDPDLRAEFERFRTTVAGLHAFPFEFAPPDFVSQVETRIRSRSKGRFFSENYLFRDRIMFEVIAIVMIIVMVAMYFFSEAPKDRHIRGDAPAAPNLVVPPSPPLTPPG